MSTKTVNALSSESYNLRDRDVTGTAACFALNYELEARIRSVNVRSPSAGTDQSAPVNSFYSSDRADCVREAS
jgi:hypothetical protein